MTLHSFGIGGCELQLLSLCRALKERNIDVVILYRSEIPGQSLKDISFSPFDPTIKCFHIPYFFYKFRLIPLYLSILFRWKIRRLPTVFHCHGMGYFTEQMLWFAQKKKIPTVLKTPGENQYSFLKQKIEARLDFRRIHSWVEARFLLESLLFGRNRLQTYSNVDAYISLNSNIKNELEDFSIDKEKIFSISNGVDTQRFSPVREEEKKILKKKFGLPEDLHYITTISRFDEGKRIRDLIHAWANLAKLFPNHRLLLIGDGPERKAYERQIALSGIGDRVFFTGVHLQPEKFLQLSDIFIFCSESEGCPNVVLEAMSSQLPIAASAIAAVQQMINKESLLFPPRDTEALQHSLRYLLEHPVEAKAMAIAAREKILNEYSFEKIAPKYISLYKSIK